MENNITVARLWHRKGKNEYFSVKQLIEKFPQITFEFHVVLDQADYVDEWSKKIDDLGVNATYYSKEFLDTYFKKSYPNLSHLVESFPKFIHFYHILIGHYLRRVLLKDYMLTYEFDIIFNGDLSDLETIIQNKVPFGIYEPQNSNCDKALFYSLSTLYQTDLGPLLHPNNPQLAGINAGFQGVNLRLFDDFLSPSNLESLVKIFDFEGIYKKDGTEKWGVERTIFDTQEQSFYSLMNQIHSSNFKLLNTEEYYFWPCWDDFPGYVEKAMQSKVVHFTGHKKSTKLLEIIDKNTIIQ